MLLLIFLITDRLTYYGLEALDEKVFTGQSVGKVNQFLSLKDSLNLLVFGNSRANHHIDNKVLNESSFNMGVDGTHIAYSAALISTLKKRGQLIIVHIDPKIIFDDTYKGKDVLSLINLINREEGVKEIINDLFPEEIYYSKICNSYIYNGKALSFLKNYFLPKYDYNLYYGYDPIYPTVEQKQIFEKIIEKDTARYSFGDSFKDMKISVLTNNLVDNIKTKCEYNNSELIFITSPTLNVVYEKQRKQTALFFKSKNIKYYDFSDFFDETPIDNWKDFTHLSEKGAALFSNKLNHVINY